MRRSARLIGLIALLAVLVGVAYVQWRGSTGSAGIPAGRAGARRTPSSADARRRPAAGASSTVPAVRLDALEAARNQPAAGPAERNPFQFQAKPLPPPPPPVVPKPGTPGSGVDAAGNPIPPPPPPPPPIPFKFIGIVQAPSQKLAVLSDNATRDVIYGHEGDVIDGRYRILRIGVESIEMAYLDGRGRQTIRLSGS